MQQELPETSEQVPQTSTSPSASSSSQHGFRRPQQSVLDARLSSRSRSTSPRSALGGVASADVVNANLLDERLRRLSGLGRRPDGHQEPAVAGQRVSDYEKAMTSSIPRQTLGFKVVKRSGPPLDGPQLTDFPNEILTHILSHLHPDSHHSVALVSKRFYALVTTPHAWRMAFIRYFPEQEALSKATGKVPSGGSDEETSDMVRSELRYFSRLTPLASWRSEYLLRTRLLRSVARGKPGTNSGGIGSASRSSQSGKRASAVLTYNSKLPWMVTHLHAVFTSAKKGPRVIHGASDFGIGTVSDPTSGKVEKWGLDDSFSFAQLDEVSPQLELHGLSDGPAATPNVMDVSQPYGLLGGEGFPGGRAYFRSAGDLRGRYLGAQENGVSDQSLEIPKVPELSEAICSVWIAKSSAVPSMTQSMVGIMTGSSLGIITTYSLGYDSSGPRYANGDITARWVVSPGVPIIAIKVDDQYNVKRKSQGRVWAVALNALGEVYYLTQSPTPSAGQSKAEDITRAAWQAGRTAYWELIECTRRTARPDEFDKNAVRGAYSPRSSPNVTQLSKEQLVAEAREIEKFLRHKPAYFRKVCEGWDMRRRLEVDFSSGDENGAGESVFVVTCGCDKALPAGVSKFSRRLAVDSADGARAATPSPVAMEKQSSIFGGGHRISSGLSTPGTPFLQSSQASAGDNVAMESEASGGAIISGWRASTLTFGNSISAEITTTGIDLSLYALLCAFEDPLQTGPQSTPARAVNTPTSKHSTGEIPGRRSRFMAVGTKTGMVIIWNMRDSADAVIPLRVVQTESPEISCLALSSLYLVHGGTDGLVQAWDPLSSTLDPIRTLNSRSSGRVPRHIINANPALHDANFSAVGAIFLDPDPMVLRGVLAFGTFLRYWTYSSTGQTASRKRRLRHSDMHGRLTSRRQGGTVMGYIAAEEAELRHEQEHRLREQARLRNRFGVGLGDLTDEEAIRYAQMISEESFLLDEQRRLSASDTGSAADIGETASSMGGSSFDTVTPEPSVSGLSPPEGRTSEMLALQDDTDDDYELQIQQALRLSLLEGVNDTGQSPRDSSGEYEFQVKYKPKKEKEKRSPSSSPAASQSHTPLVQQTGSSRCTPLKALGADPNDDLELALKLSLEEEQSRRDREVGLGIHPDDFPALRSEGKGKGKRL